MGPLWRHPFLFIIRGDPIPQFTVPGLAGCDDGSILARGQRAVVAIGEIESKITFAVFFARTMASKTLVRENRTNLTIECNGLIAAGQDCGNRKTKRNGYGFQGISSHAISKYEIHDDPKF